MFFPIQPEVMQEMAKKLNLLERMDTEPIDAKIGFEYIHKKSCPECGGDVQVGVGVYVRCLTASCDHKYMGG